MKKAMPALLIFLLTIFLVPINTNAKTLKELEEEVKKFTNELQSKNNQIAANDAEVAEIEERIKSIQSQIKEITNETTTLESEIAESNQEIGKFYMCFYFTVGESKLSNLLLFAVLQFN